MPAARSRDAVAAARYSGPKVPPGVIGTRGDRGSLGYVGETGATGFTGDRGRTGVRSDIAAPVQSGLKGYRLHEGGCGFTVTLLRLTLSVVEFDSTITDLGVVLDSLLSMQAQVAAVCRSCFYTSYVSCA